MRIILPGKKDLGIYWCLHLPTHQHVLHARRNKKSQSQMVKSFIQFRLHWWSTEKENGGRQNLKPHRGSLLNSAIQKAWLTDKQDLKCFKPEHWLEVRLEKCSYAGWAEASQPRMLPFCLLLKFSQDSIFTSEGKLNAFFHKYFNSSCIFKAYCWTSKSMYIQALKSWWVSSVLRANTQP